MLTPWGISTPVHPPVRKPTLRFCPFPCMKLCQLSCLSFWTMSICWKRSLLLALLSSLRLRAFVFSSSVSLISSHCEVSDKGGQLGPAPGPVRGQLQVQGRQHRGAHLGYLSQHRLLLHSFPLWGGHTLVHLAGFRHWPNSKEGHLRQDIWRGGLRQPATCKLQGKWAEREARGFTPPPCSHSHHRR